MDPNSAMVFVLIVIAIILAFLLVRCSITLIRFGADFLKKIVNISDFIDGYLELEVDWPEHTNRPIGALKLFLTTNRGRR